MSRCIPKTMPTILSVMLMLSVFGPTLIASDAGAETRWFRVDNVRPGSVLWIRSGPGRSFKKLGFLPYSTRHIYSTGCKLVAKRFWCKVRYRGVKGWVSKRYLAADTRRRT